MIFIRSIFCVSCARLFGSPSVLIFTLATTVATWKVFGGSLTRYTHSSTSTKTDMNFSVFVPPNAKNVPVIYFLSGLECTDQNFAQKATHAFKVAVETNVAIILPDTSPRGAGVPGDKDSWDFGEGAGFYLDATTEGFSAHYNMRSYVTVELPAVVQATLGDAVDTTKASIMGHSMGGHGALTLYLRQDAPYVSCSAFAPITHPSVVPWGQKAFAGYLGVQDAAAAAWAAHDATELVSGFPARVGAAKAAQGVMIDQGLGDKFLETQLRPADFTAAATAAGVAVQYRALEGYDHGYFFIASVVEDHVRYHAKFLHA